MWWVQVRLIFSWNCWCWKSVITRSDQFYPQPSISILVENYWQLCHRSYCCQYQYQLYFHFHWNYSYWNWNWTRFLRWKLSETRKFSFRVVIWWSERKRLQFHSVSLRFYRQFGILMRQDGRKGRFGRVIQNEPNPIYQCQYNIIYIYIKGIIEMNKKGTLEIILRSVWVCDNFGRFSIGFG